MTLAGTYAVVVGGLMIVQWAFFLASGNVPELKTEPIRILGHLAAEFTSALALILSGIGLLADTSWALTAAPFALGMLIYTLIESPMYFVQKRQWPIVGMFAVLFMLALASTYLVFDHALA